MAENYWNAQEFLNCTETSKINLGFREFLKCTEEINLQRELNTFEWEIIDCVLLKGAKSENFSQINTYLKRNIFLLGEWTYWKHIQVPNNFILRIDQIVMLLVSCTFRISSYKLAHIILSWPLKKKHRLFRSRYSIFRIWKHDDKNFHKNIFYPVMLEILNSWVGT